MSYSAKVILNMSCSELLNICQYLDTESKGEKLIDGQRQARNHYSEFTDDRWIPAQMASNVENVFIWWRHHKYGQE